MRVYDRSSKKYEEAEQYGGGALKFLYTNPVGRILLRLAVSPLVSNVYACFMSLPSSAKKIPGFIEKYGIDMSEYEGGPYTSFNEFFTRRFAPGAREMDSDIEAFVSPADSKLLVYGIDENLMMNIKGREYTPADLVGKRDYAEDFDGGYALVFRLCMDDCHRYCFVDDGHFVDHYMIKGKLHTVSSISKDHKIYKENTRVVSVLDTANFGKLIQIEVGAMLVGRINNSYPENFNRGDEKGFFEPGGSTIIILVKRDAVAIDEDILAQSRNGIETKIKYGEKIGKKKCLED
jgi:phosphatidylserine decarboxylase